MAMFYHVEPENPSKRCKFIFPCLKDPFSNCCTITEAISASKAEDEHQVTDIDDEEVIISAIRSGALEKLRKKSTMLMSDSLLWVYSPNTKELYITPKGSNENKEEVKGFEEYEEFLSMKSCFSCRSSTDTDRDLFVSAKASFSQSSSLNGNAFEVDLNELQRRSIIREFCHCEGWPFGLCRKVVLLPPLPKSPSESWSWRKGSTKTLKLTF